jgi:hypothetical protein
MKACHDPPPFPAPSQHLQPQSLTMVEKTLSREMGAICQPQWLLPHLGHVCLPVSTEHLSVLLFSSTPSIKKTEEDWNYIGPTCQPGRGQNINIQRMVSTCKTWRQDNTGRMGWRWWTDISSRHLTQVYCHIMKVLKPSLTLLDEWLLQSVWREERGKNEGRLLYNKA